jgi:hypothetical protein
MQAVARDQGVGVEYYSSHTQNLREQVTCASPFSNLNKRDVEVKFPSVLIHDLFRLFLSSHDIIFMGI